MIERDNRLVMMIIPLFRLVFKNNLGTPVTMQKWQVLGGVGYHGNLLEVFGF